MTGHYRYIRLHMLDMAVRAGWMVLADLVETHHGEHAALCHWPCACPEAWPLEVRP